MFSLRKMPPQADTVLLQKLCTVDTATIGHKWQSGFMDAGIAPILPNTRIAGTAVTLALPAQDSTLLHHATGLLRPNDILVVDRLGDRRYACLGGGVALAIQLSGSPGIIIDGPCTDFEEIESFGFPVWSRGCSPITTRLQSIGGSMNISISCGGVQVNPGDIIFADCSGVVVLKPETAQKAADWATQRLIKEKETWQRLQNGEKMGDISGATAKVLANLTEDSQI